MTKQPGDNFRVVASCNPNFDGYHADTNSATGAIVNTNGNPLTWGCVTEMLTVWRRLHIEVDSMAAVANNEVTGNITAISGNALYATHVTLDVNLRTGLTPQDDSKNLNDSPPGNGRFENGTITIGTGGGSPGATTTSGLFGKGVSP